VRSPIPPTCKFGAHELCARSKPDKPVAVSQGVRLTPGVAGFLHEDEIPIDAGLVRALVDRAMPHLVGLPVLRLDSSGSSNALFRLGEDLLVRLPRQPGGAATIAKEARWLPVLGPLLPVDVPEIVAVFEPGCDYPERWSVVRWIDGERTLGWSPPRRPSTRDGGTWQQTLPRW
jgi:aminoglycoside phosphotransferase (APT) family kinase protein